MLSCISIASIGVPLLRKESSFNLFQIFGDSLSELARQHLHLTISLYRIHHFLVTLVHISIVGASLAHINKVFRELLPYGTLIIEVLLGAYSIRR